jgi:signal peptidase I
VSEPSSKNWSLILLRALWRAILYLLLAVLLGPGWYAAKRGRAKAALFANGIWSTAWIIFALALNHFAFAPTFPLMAMGLLFWVLEFIFVSHPASRAKHPLPEPPPLRLGRFTPAMVWAVVLCWAYWVPMLVSRSLLVDHWSLIVPFDTNMAPTILEHEVILVDRTQRDLGDYRRGQLVLYTEPSDEEASRIGRIVALPGDEVTLEEGQIIVNGQAVPQFELDDQTRAMVVSAIGDRADAMRLWFEVVEGRKYVVVGPRQAIFGQAPEWVIGEGEFLAFNDERMNRDDSRNFGPLPEAAIAGKPLFIVHHGGQSDQVGRVSMRVQPRETAAALQQTAKPAPAK